MAREPGSDLAAFAKRHTFLIDPEGVVRRVYEVSDVQAHPEAVLADVLAAAGH